MDILIIFENYGANHKVMFLLFIAIFGFIHAIKWQFYIIRPFWVNASAEAGAYRIGPHFWVFWKITSYYATCFLEGTFILPVSVKMHANMQGGIHKGCPHLGERGVSRKRTGPGRGEGGSKIPKKGRTSFMNDPQHDMHEMSYLVAS